MKWVVGVSMIAVAMGWVATATIPAATVSIDEANLKFLPPETEAVAFVDVAALRNAPLVQYVFDVYRPTIEGHPPDFMTVTGFVPQRDIDHVTVGKINAQETVAIIDARYDRFKAEQYLSEKGTPSEAYRGRTLFSFDLQHGQAYGSGAVVLLDNLIIAGQSNAVKETLDQMSLPGAPALRSDLMAAIATIEAGNQIWGVGEVSLNELTSAGVRGPAPAIEMLKSLKGGTYQMRIDTGIHARATGNFADEDSAKNVRDLAKGALAIAKLQIAKQQPDVLHLLDGIQVSASGMKVVVEVDESGDLLKKLQHVRIAANK